MQKINLKSKIKIRNIFGLQIFYQIEYIDKLESWIICVTKPFLYVNYKKSKQEAYINLKEAIKSYLKIKKYL